MSERDASRDRLEKILLKAAEWVLRHKDHLIVAAADGLGDARWTAAELRALKHNVLKRHRHRCFYCGAPAAVVDHVIPSDRGGMTVSENLVASCNGCNSVKGAR